MVILILNNWFVECVCSPLGMFKIKEGSEYVFCWPTHIPKCIQTYSSSCSSVASKDALFLSSRWAEAAVYTLLLICTLNKKIKMNSSAGCQVSAATCGTVALVWGRLYGCIGLSLDSVKSHFPWVQWHFPGWRMGRWGQRGVAGNACRCPSQENWQSLES